MRRRARRANRLSLFTVDRWGEQWHLADAKPRRSLSSVVLDADAARTLQDDIHAFFTRRDWYAQTGHTLAPRLPAARPAGHRQDQRGLSRWPVNCT